MFVEERIYTFYPGKLPEYLKLYTEEGMAIQTRYLPAMVGYYTSEIGTLNLLIHMWGYEDLKQRSTAREAAGRSRVAGLPCRRSGR